MVKVLAFPVKFTEEAFLNRLGLNGKDIGGVRAICIDHRYVVAVEGIECITVVLNVVSNQPNMLLSSLKELDEKEEPVTP